MIEVRVPIPFAEYVDTRDQLEARFNEHAIPVFLSADTVIRTWAGLVFYQWFVQQVTDVEYHIGYGELDHVNTGDTMTAAVSADFPDEDCQVFVVMLFHDGDEHDEDDEYATAQRNLALLFKLTFGGS